jgi:glycosyltransferase involved in cell wall biosynthesis
MKAKNKYQKIFIALPAMNEVENMPAIISDIRGQTFKNFELFVCVNQPDDFWNDQDKKNICENNEQTINLLKRITDFPITIIDKSSHGNGWTGKKFGVGWARKVCMDSINEKADENDLIISLDADTRFSENYFSSLIDNFNSNPGITALSVPYYHRLVEDEIANRAILHYEIYMRYYSINLWRIKNPYSFSALGSAIVLPVKSYRHIGGITPHKSGEDFYFLQKLCKTGKILCRNSEKVFPAARFSDRVFFGTGPAMIKGSKGDWSSYPIYDYTFFDEINSTFDLFPKLFTEEITTPMTSFLQAQFNTTELWEPLRKNFKTQDQFVKACQNKVDGLRILQFLKTKQMENTLSDEENLISFLFNYYDKTELENLGINFNEFSFSNSSIGDLDRMRDYLINKETNEMVGY